MIEVSTALGVFWAPSEQQASEIALVMNEQAEGSAHRYVCGKIRIGPGDIVIDCGAHLGVITRMALELGAERVVAIEPQASNVAALERTFACEVASGRVLLVNAALWSSAGLLCFAGTEDWGRQTLEVTGNRAVAAVTLDEVVSRLALPRVDFIKLDCEGAERHILRGARETLTRWRPRFAACAHHLPDDREAMAAVLRESGVRYNVVDTGHMMFGD